jgi:hypothetical protein
MTYGTTRRRDRQKIDAVVQHRPQVGKSDGNPSPKKLSADAVMIVLATPGVAGITLMKN